MVVNKFHMFTKLDKTLQHKNKALHNYTKPDKDLTTRHKTLQHVHGKKNLQLQTLQTYSLLFVLTYSKYQ